MSKKNFKFIDLFAGIGGIRIPFDELNGDCVFSSEFDKYAAQTYSENFGHLPHGDITKIDLDEIPKHDLLLAGFPCQAFSMAGKRKGFEDTRGTLFFNIEKILEARKPKAFLLENVRGLINYDNGKTFQTIQSVLSNKKKLNYNVHFKVLNAKDYALPQNRSRIFIVGFKNQTDFSFPDPLNTKTKLSSILQKRVQAKYTISDLLWDSHQKRRERNQKRGVGFGYSLVKRDTAYTRTISSRYYKDGSEILLDQPGKNPRMLTPREALRLQGFPESFVMPVSDNQAYKQVGNAVPVNVVRQIAKEMIKYL